SFILTILLIDSSSPFTPYTPYTLHPPSFPTRRSSDLGFLAQSTLDKYTSGQLRRTAIKLSVFCGVSVDGFLARPESHRRSLRRRDRKSTRLNSSHGSISYAVFCLKKKTEQEITTHKQQ